MNFGQPILYFLAFTFGVCSAGLLSQQYEVDAKWIKYHWKDYNGEIPNDAVPGGVDKDGATTYIGQVIHSIGQVALHPGQIHPGYKNISYVADGRPYVATRFIKILCSSQPEKLHWIRANTQQMRYLLAQQQFVVGGDLDDYPLLIGLASRRDQVILGKITIRLGLEGISYVEDNLPIYESSYQVLAVDSECN